MAVTYTWTVNSMMTLDASAEEPNYVVSVAYTLKGVEGDYSSEIQNTAFFEVGESVDFTPYDKLTQDMVIGWVQTQLGPDAIGNYEYCITDQIANQINPPVTPQSQPLPWG